MPDLFKHVDFSSHGRTGERLPGEMSLYDLENFSNLAEFREQLERFLSRIGLRTVRVYDKWGKAFLSDDCLPRTEPVMFSAFRGRLYTPPSARLRKAYESLGTLDGTVKRIQRENGQSGVFLQLDGPTREKMKIISAMELEEADSLGVHVVLRPTEHQSTIRGFLDGEWGVYEPTGSAPDEALIFSVKAPYSPQGFRLMTNNN